jgi:hypothetical protein
MPATGTIRRLPYAAPAALIVLALTLSAASVASAQRASMVASREGGAATIAVRPSTVAARPQTEAVVVRLRFAANPVSSSQRALARVKVRLRSPYTTEQARSLRGARVVVRVRGTGVQRRVAARLSHRRAAVRLPRLAAGSYRVRAVFTGTAVLDRSRSRARPLSVTQAPGTPSPTPTNGFPDDSTTGVPPGTTLTPYTGPSTISVAGTVIDGKAMGCIRVTAPGVVIRNSHISCTGQTVVGAFDGAFSGEPLLLEDVEIDCQNGPGTGVGDAFITVRRADVHGCENGFDLNQSVIIEDSYVHDLWNGAGAHADGIQFAGGHFENGTLVDAALNLTIRHNTIYSVGYDGSLTNASIISNPRGDRNILIEKNLMAGGSYTLYCDYEGTATNYRVIDNHFSRVFRRTVGAYGPSEGCSDETLSGNVYHEMGAPVRMD